MTQPRTTGSPDNDRSLSRVMALYGFAMFMLVYMVQPLMPRFVAEFGVIPAVASQPLSASTAGMALFLIPASLYVDRFPRRALLVGGLLACGLLSVLTAWVRDFELFIGLRFALGMAMSALPATALAYLTESVSGERVGRSVGLYIAGNAMGGMSGRLLALTLSEWMDWRYALASLGVLALLMVLYVATRLPVQPPVHTRRKTGPAGARIRTLLTDPGLLMLFALAFLFSGCIVSVYNYVSFRLGAAPYHFGYQALCGIYALYVTGMLGSSRVGRLSDRFGHSAVLFWLPVVMAFGLWLTLLSGVIAIITGMAVLTFGFFAGHSVASSWVSLRAPGDRALASSLYLTMYYLGASVLGTAAGAVWAEHRWVGVVLMDSATLGVALVLALWMRRVRLPRPCPDSGSNQQP